MAEQLQLRPYQSRMVQHILENPHCALWADMGAGKTAVALWAICRMLEVLDVSKVLVVAPKRVAEKQWPEEIAQWSQFSGLTHRVITVEDFRLKRVEVKITRKGRTTKLLRLVPQATPQTFLTVEVVHIVSRDQFAYLVEVLKLRSWCYDMLVLDESSGFRDQTSKRFKAARVLRKHGCAPRLLQLTGTPRPRSMLDLWAQLYLLDQGERLGRTYGAYRDAYFLPARTGRDPHGRLTVFKWALRPGAEQLITERLSDICISLLPEDVLALPERTINRVQVELPPQAREVYARMEREQLLRLEGRDVVAASAAALVGRLLQIAGGAAYDEDGGWHLVHTAKLDAMEEIIDGLNGAPLLVAYWFKHERERIKERFPHAVELKDYPDTEERWNRGEIDLLLLHPQSGAHGLNLQFNDGQGLWFGPIHDLELWQQWNKRLHRPGRKTPVFVHVLLARDTIDSAVLDSLGPKGEGQDRLLQAVRLRIEEIRGER